VLIVGMGRSGSSALARVLSLCGGALPLGLPPADFANPSEYWEPARALELNEAVFASNGSSWYDGSLPLQTGLVSADAREDFCSAIAEFLQTGFEGGGPIVLKEPRISGLLPYWIGAVTELGWPLKVVHLFRNPGDVGASLATRNGLTIPHADTLWLKYNLIAERDARGLPRIFVSFEALLRDWQTALERCIGELDLDLTQDDRRGRTRRRRVSLARLPSRTSFCQAGEGTHAAYGVAASDLRGIAIRRNRHMARFRVRRDPCPAPARGPLHSGGNARNRSDRAIPGRSAHR